MRFCSSLPFLVCGLLPIAFTQDINNETVVERRQLQTIGLSSSGVTAITSSISTSSTSITSKSSSSSSSSKPSTTTTQIPSTTVSADPMIITTTFTQPTDCVGGITELATATDLWENVINPVSSMTLTSCYPSQFYASAMATTSLPPFKQLVCPYEWETYDVNSTYAICCPNGYGFYAPNYSNVQRPGLDAICTSSIWPSILMDITSYDSTGGSTIVPTTADVNGTLVLATAFDGTIATSAATSTNPSSSSATITSSTSSIVSPSSSSAKPTSTSSKPISTTSTKVSSSSTSTKPSTTTTGITAISQLPICGQTCFNNLLGQYSSLGCTTEDPSCVCRNINFYYGIRDCSNGACGTAVASTVIAFESSYCASAIAAQITFPVTTTATTTALSSLPSCGQTCFNNMVAQYSALGCSSPAPACLCENVNFGYGLRDCSNGACGTAVASTVIAYGSAYCASATAVPTAK